MEAGDPPRPGCGCWQEPIGSCGDRSRGKEPPGRLVWGPPCGAGETWGLPRSAGLSLRAVSSLALPVCPPGWACPSPDISWTPRGPHAHLLTPPVLEFSLAPGHPIFMAGSHHLGPCPCQSGLLPTNHEAETPHPFPAEDQWPVLGVLLPAHPTLPC